MKDTNPHIDYTLIARYLSGETPVKDSKKVKEWIDANEDNRKEFERLKKLWEEAENLSGTGKAPVNTDAAWEKLRSRMKASKDSPGGKETGKAPEGREGNLGNDPTRGDSFRRETYGGEEDSARRDPNSENNSGTEAFSGEKDTPGGDLTGKDTPRRDVGQTHPGGEVSSPMGSVPEESIPGKTVRTRSMVTYVLTRAAAIVLLAVVIYSVFQLLKTPSRQIELMAGNTIEETELPDNSTVTLNENSTLNYPVKFARNERVVELKGEAFFEVSEAKEKPFIIRVPDARIEVLGTRFNVKAPEGEEEVSVTVQEGRVRFSDNENIAYVILEDHEKGVLNRSTGHIEKFVSTDESDLFWKTRTVIFRTTTLSEVFTTLSRLYEVEISVQDKKINDCVLTAKFEDMTIADILDKIALSFELKINKSDDTYEISGDGC